MNSPLYNTVSDHPEMGNAQVCAVCGKAFPLFSGTVVRHGRAHVRKGEATERPVITVRDLRAPSTRFEVR